MRARNPQFIYFFKKKPEYLRKLKNYIQICLGEIHYMYSGDKTSEIGFHILYYIFLIFYSDILLLKDCFFALIALF